MKYIKLEIHEIIQRKTLKVTTNILEQQSEKKRQGVEIVASNSLSIPQIYRLISHRTFSNYPISFAVESAKLSGLGEPGKDWPPHALNFQARRAQSVIRYRLNSPSIFLSLSLFLCFSLFHPFFFSFVPLIFFSSLSPSLFPIFLFSLFLPFSLFFFLVFPSSTARSWTTLQPLSRDIERRTNLVSSRCDSCFLASKSNRSNQDIRVWGWINWYPARKSVNPGGSSGEDFSDKGILMGLTRRNRMYPDRRHPTERKKWYIFWSIFFRGLT